MGLWLQVKTSVEQECTPTDSRHLRSSKCFHKYFVLRIEIEAITFVRVPVLSKTTVSSSARRSRTSPPLSSKPCLAAIDEATSTAVGVASPNAHGQATTRTFTANLSPKNVPPATPAACIAIGNMPAPAVHMAGKRLQSYRQNFLQQLGDYGCKFTFKFYISKSDQNSHSILIWTPVQQKCCRHKISWQGVIALLPLDLVLNLISTSQCLGSV